MEKIKFFIIFGILAAMLSSAHAQLPPESEWKEEGVCARVRIQISQDVALTRTAFKATLEIDNSPENVPIENLKVTIDIKNSEDKSSNDLFGIKAPELTGIDDMNGGGILAPGQTAKAVWIIVPSRDAATDTPTQYYVGGTLSYSESGTQMNMPLFPASITVKPDPRLVLNYFLQRVVYSDDPFTKDIIEPEEPFPLGLILSNQGKGTARKVKITSSQPKIIENEKGLMIDFKIISTRVNTEPVSPSLTVDLGEIGPGQSSVAQWIMTSSLAGKFIEYEAKFEHVDELGDPRFSLIDSVNIHEIIHAVRADVPDDDQKPDFLANDVEDDNFMPDTLYKSDGSTAPVNVASNPVISGQITAANLKVTLTASAPNGWVYIRADDPGKEAFVLKKVVRSDGREIRMEDNAWTTHRTIRLIGQPAYRQNLLHLFDSVSSGSASYTLTYEALSDVPKPPVLMFIPDRTFAEGIHFGFIVKASDPNGTIPKLSAEPIPKGASFTDKGNGEGAFDWPTTSGQAGKYELIFTASDGSLSDSQLVIITIESGTASSSITTTTTLLPSTTTTSTLPATSGNAVDDMNSNGIPDSQEVTNQTDLDNNGIPDITQNDIKSLKTVVGDGQIGVKGYSNINAILSIKSIDANVLTNTTNKPLEVPLGVVSFNVETTKPGDKAIVMIYLSKSAPTAARWYKYDSKSGWEDFSGYAAFMDDKKSVMLSLVDGGIGDADGVANGVIVHTSGFGVGSPVQSTSANNGKSVTDSSQGGAGDTNCFIETAGDRHKY